MILLCMIVKVQTITLINCSNFINTELQTNNSNNLSINSKQNFFNQMLSPYLIHKFDDTLVNVSSKLHNDIEGEEEEITTSISLGKRNAVVHAAAVNEINQATANSEISMIYIVESIVKNKLSNLSKNTTIEDLEFIEKYKKNKKNKFHINMIQQFKKQTYLEINNLLLESTNNIIYKNKINYNIFEAPYTNAKNKLLNIFKLNNKLINLYQNMYRNRHKRKLFAILTGLSNDERKIMKLWMNFYRRYIIFTEIKRFQKDFTHSCTDKAIQVVLQDILTANKKEEKKPNLQIIYRFIEMFQCYDKIHIYLKRTFKQYLKDIQQQTSIIMDNTI